MDNKDDVNKKLPSGYYLKGDNIIKGCDTLVRECGGNVTKLPPVIIATTLIGKTTKYKSNIGNDLNSIGNEFLKNNYLKIIEKKEYSYDFSNFYYIEGESAPATVPTKLLLHSVNDNGYQFGEYIYDKEIKQLIYLFSRKFMNTLTGLGTSDNLFSNIEILSNNYNGVIHKFIEVTKSNPFFKVNEKNKIQNFNNKPKVFIKIQLFYGLNKIDPIIVCFIFDTNIIKSSISITHPSSTPETNRSDFLNVSVKYFNDKLRNIENLKSTEPYQYGVYRLKNTKNYIALKFDINDALPTFIQNLYTKEPCEQSDSSMKASLLKNEGGSENDPKNIITPEETLTEIYVIKSY